MPDLKMNMKSCVITDADRCRLGSLLTSSEGRAWGGVRNRHILDARLEEATPVSLRETPTSLVTMNSIVELLDTNSGDRRQVALAYPTDVDFVLDGVSVLDPLGIKLLGCKVGDIIVDNARQFRVAKIVYQPEAAGALHL